MTLITVFANNTFSKIRSINSDRDGFMCQSWAQMSSFYSQTKLNSILLSETIVSPPIVARSKFFFLQNLNFIIIHKKLYKIGDKKFSFLCTLKCPDFPDTADPNRKE